MSRTRDISNIYGSDDFSGAGNIVSISNNYTALEDDIIFVNTASTAITITLPSSPSSGGKIKVLDVAANSQNNNITILGNTYNINSASAYVVNTPDSSVDLIYIGSNKGWIVSNEYISISKPGVPTSVSATDVGTGREYNNGAATVSFAPSTSGDPASSYTVVSTPGSYSGSGASSPIIVTGLQSNTSYTFTVIATNAAGSSTTSTASNSITATTVPQAPTINSATYGFEKVSVAFTANATGGKAISSYSVTSNPGSSVVSGASSPLTISSLTGGTAYTFTATATNDNGTSAASTASSSATPFTASGGAITTSGGFRIHTFTGTSNFVLTGNNVNVQYLVVAGGGGGGGAAANAAGAGGAGGYRCSVVGEASGGGASAESLLTLTPNTYTATVGGPGSGSGGTGGGGNGGNSVFSSITSVGGGGGGAQNGPAGASGGSGGGGAYLLNGGAGTANQGFAGANFPGGGAFAGGGGGAASAGSGSSAGAGVQSNIDGTPTTRAVGGTGSSNATGTTNRGNGGGSATGGGAGLNGGSGIVIVRYAV